MVSGRPAAEGLRSSRVSTRLERTGAGITLRSLHPPIYRRVSLAFPVLSLARDTAEGISAAPTIKKSPGEATQTTQHLPDRVRP